MINKNKRPLPEILRQTGPIKKRKQRVRASILLVQGGAVYLLKSIINRREVWFLPGGSVKWGETLADAAIREAEEELGVEVKIKELIALFDSISPKADFHSIEAVFLAETTHVPRASGEAAEVEEITENQYSVEGKWFTPEKLLRIEAYPRNFLKDFLTDFFKHQSKGLAAYLGNDWD